MFPTNLALSFPRVGLGKICGRRVNLKGRDDCPTQSVRKIGRQERLPVQPVLHDASEAHARQLEIVMPALRVLKMLCKCVVSKSISLLLRDLSGLELTACHSRIGVRGIAPMRLFTRRLKLHPQRGIVLVACHSTDVIALIAVFAGL